jgi:hypothetical protein
MDREAPSNSAGRFDLAKYAPITFSSDTASQGSTTKSTSRWINFPVTMIQNTTDATVSGLKASGGAFTDTWRNYS